jgi:hypothetical protein
VFVMKPLFIPHASYQVFVLKQLQLHYSGGILVVHKDHWPLIAKLWITDLSPITTMLAPLYEDKGPESRDPASMLRSYLVNLLVRPELGITAWVKEMYTVPLYAILSGFQPGDIPGVGTFYDFFPRLQVPIEFPTAFSDSARTFLISMSNFTPVHLLFLTHRL